MRGDSTRVVAHPFGRGAYVEATGANGSGHWQSHASAATLHIRREHLRGRTLGAGAGRLRDAGTSNTLLTSAAGRSGAAAAHTIGAIVRRRRRTRRTSNSARATRGQRTGCASIPVAAAVRATGRVADTRAIHQVLAGLAGNDRDTSTGDTLLTSTARGSRAAAAGAVHARVG